MRLSCNGCRVLRKGCSVDCSIRPCLQWIKNPDSQGHATVFLAKFYGRAGLINLITSGPEHLRPAIFRSLLYEACGRIVNPIYGSVGLCSGNWQLCQDAVEAVLKGSPITQIASETAVTNNGPPLKAYDIRHIPKDTNNSSGSNQLHRSRNRCRFKKSVGKPKTYDSGRVIPESNSGREKFERSSSHESSSLSHLSDVTVNYVEACDQGSAGAADFEYGLSGSDGEIELELTLGFEPRPTREVNKKCKRSDVAADEDGGLCKMELGIINQTAENCRWY